MKLISILYFFGILFVFHVSFVKSELPLLNITGFTWAENLAFDTTPGRSQLYVSDAGTGTIWKIYLNSAGDAYQKAALAQFSRTNGLQMSANSTYLYANVMVENSDKSTYFAVATVNPALSTNNWKILSQIPLMGNGLALHEVTSLLYLTYEGNEIPGAGKVYMVDTLGQIPVTEVVSGLQGTDGCRIDPLNHWLYISDVVAATLNVYQLPTSRSQATANLTLVAHFKAPGMKFLDDFALDWQQGLIFGADFATGRVVRFPSTGTPSTGTVVASGLLNPTSVQIGTGASFNHTSIYVTEGGGVPHFNTDRRVIEFRGQVEPLN